MAYKIRDLVLALICAFLGSINGLLVHEVKSLGAIEIFGLRSVGAVCFILPVVIFFNYALLYGFKFNVIILIRAVIGNIAVCGYYFGFVYLPLAQASMLFYSTPLFTVIIGRLFLKEQCGLGEVLSVFLSLLGVCLVCIPDIASVNQDTSNVIKGVLGSLIGAIAQSAALVVVRKITHIPPVVVSFWWALVGIVFSLSFYGFQEHGGRLWSCGLETTFIVLIAVVGFVSELCLVYSLKSTDAVLVSIVLTSEIAWAFVFQTFVNRDMPNVMSILGAVAIVMSVAMPPLVEYSRTRIYGKTKK